MNNISDGVENGGDHNKSTDSIEEMLDRVHKARAAREKSAKKRQHETQVRGCPLSCICRVTS